jgi:ABC-2 type transport system ATP-binding protein
MPEREIDARIKEMLEIFELGKWQNELVESFSHGMKQRSVMSAAFLHRPKAVLVDEPMVGPRSRGARLIKDVFRRMTEHGVAILMSTHTLEVAQEMCDLISIILKGKIIAHGTVAGATLDRRFAERGADAGFLKLTVGSGLQEIEESSDRDHPSVSVSPECRPCGRRVSRPPPRAGERRPRDRVRLASALADESRSLSAHSG